MWIQKNSADKEFDMELQLFGISEQLNEFKIEKLSLKILVTV